jgi:hypothetical protein
VIGGLYAISVAEKGIGGRAHNPEQLSNENEIRRRTSRGELGSVRAVPTVNGVNSGRGCRFVACGRCKILL